MRTKTTKNPRMTTLRRRKQRRKKSRKKEEKEQKEKEEAHRVLAGAGTIRQGRDDFVLCCPLASMGAWLYPAVARCAEAIEIH